MTIRIRLPGRTLKIKKRDELRRREQKREVPVWQVSNYFVIWWPSGMSGRPFLAQKILAQEITRASDDLGSALTPRCGIRNRRARPNLRRPLN
ncbi:hypothetical protein [Mesorhizobium sp. M0895]|uniref:hypothetical protein n=1 Tax=Mesorhizobium sp. M0895 TaxID=2957019 RepID=UPI0033380A2A